MKDTPITTRLISENHKATVRLLKTYISLSSNITNSPSPNTSPPTNPYVQQSWDEAGTPVLCLTTPCPEGCAHDSIER